MDKKQLKEINRIAEQCLEKICAPYPHSMCEFMKVDYFGAVAKGHLSKKEIEHTNSEKFDYNKEYALIFLKAFDLIEYPKEKEINATPQGYKVYLTGGWGVFIDGINQENKNRRRLLKLQNNFYILFLNEKLCAVVAIFSAFLFTKN